MKRTVYVSNSPEYCLKWDNKTLNEVADEIEAADISFDKTYRRNILGDFFGTFIFETEKDVYNFPMSKKITHSPKADSDLLNCKGRHFRWPIKDKYLQDTGKNNLGFVICDSGESITPCEPLEHDPIRLLPEDRRNLLVGKSLSVVFEERMILEIKKETGRFLFCDSSTNSPYLIIDEYKVCVSYAVAALTEEQLVRELDSLVFYQGEPGDKPWFRLGLPYVGKLSEIRPAFSPL
jgi:hypothetical protein